MKANQLATLVLRLLGIYILIEATPTLVTSYGEIHGASMRGDTFPLFGIFSILIARIIFGILLIAFSGSWGQKITPRKPAKKKFRRFHLSKFRAFGFALVGVLIFADALPQLFYYIFYLLTMVFQGFLVSLSAPMLLGSILKAAVGLWMFFRAKSFTHFWHSRQNFDTPKPPQTP